jgi:hypothetical protein
MTYQVPQATTGYTGLEFAVFQQQVSHYNQYRLVTTSTGDGYVRAAGAYKSLRHTMVLSGVDYAYKEVFKTPNYTATTENSRCIRLAPNKKIMIQYQFLPRQLDSLSSAWLDWSFGFNNEGSDSNVWKQKSDPSNTFVTGTTHYKNYVKQGYNNDYSSSIGEVVISHSESGDRNICIHFASSSDYSGITNTSSFSSSLFAGISSWFKIIQLD